MCGFQLALDMIVFLVNLLMTTDHCHLIKRSFSAMGHLRRTVVWSSAEERQVAGHCTLIEKQILADFVEYINAPVSTITCDEVSGTHVCAILRVLFAITIKLYVAVVDDLASATNCLVYSQDTDNDGSNHNVGLLIDRLHQLHYSLVAMIRGDIDHSIRILVFNILVEMVILFGNHKAAIKNDPGFVFFFNRLLPEVEPSIVHFAYETMECAADLEKCKSETDLSTAVDILKKICRLFEMGYIRFEPIGDFLALTGKIPEIDIFVHRVLESFVRRSPMMYKTVAIVIFKGILKVCEKSITNCRQVSNGSSSSTRLELAKDVKTVVDSWLHYDDFYQVWRKRHITATVKMMLELFARKSGCLEMEQLTVSVFDEPPQESDSRIHSIDNDSTTDDESSAVGTNRAQRAELVVAESVFSDKTRDDHSGTRDDHSGTGQLFFKCP
ncbi:Hypothetical protein NTJ_05633 [Nesidiocoris tenuis]|uniref:Uncharacterized protein n=1 Tax=Nesidiocoris tenuis TaxID=355587 RepID=A0ABN7AN39_9HEMI|nr:Hypothetical protein NTJ_05633 [Nesidiocoris tenuis]